MEGYDAPYYSTRVEITDSQSRRAEFINCGGKKGVVDTCGYIAGKPAYKKFVTLYFVDKDYDDNSALSDKIFVTDGYSVENYYASDRCVRSAIKGLAAIPVDRYFLSGRSIISRFSAVESFLEGRCMYILSSF